MKRATAEVLAILPLAFLLGLACCGKNDALNTDLKVVGGSKASYYPYFVQLIDGVKTPRGFCGGTLIAPRVVLTAAHCIHNESAKELYVAMGMNDGESLHLTRPVKVIGIAKHPEYAGVPEHGNDLAVLYLELYQTDQFRNPIKPVSLDRSGVVQISEMLRVVGLGRLSSLGTVRSTEIKQVDLPVVDPALCRKIYDVTDRQLCAGDIANGGKDSCKGDSGGPLLRIKSGGEAELIGIVSYGKGCAQKKQPGVYTKVAAYMPWIEQKSKELAVELDPSKPEEMLPTVVVNRCLAQVNGILERVTKAEHVRETTWKTDDAKVKYTLVNKKPQGAALATCKFEDRAFDATTVRWFLSEGSAKTVVAVVEMHSGKIYQSTPIPLKYAADSLLCETARGKVAFYDTRSQSLISYNERMYHFGMTVPDPANDQTTWGCQVGNMVVEVFESAKAGKLAVRASHPAIGTVVKLLEIDDIPPEQMLKTWISKDQNNLMVHIKNVGQEDLVTWEMECMKPFSFKLKNGATLEARSRGTGSGFYATLIVGAHSEATIKAGESLELNLQSQSDGAAGYGCFINQMFAVVDP